MAEKRRKLNSGASQAQPVLAKSKSALLYDACMAKRGNELDYEFTIKEMKEYGITTDEAELVNVCQDLLDTSLFIIYKRWDEVSVYRLRGKVDALKISKLPDDARMVLQQVEVAGRSGIWKKTLQSKANLHENTVTKSLKELVAKGLIKEFKTAKNTAKRMYVFHNLEPSEESTGGTFYREGELDEGLVVALSDIIVEFVRDHSWARLPLPISTKKQLDSRTDGNIHERPLYRAYRTQTNELVAYGGDHRYPSSHDVLRHIRKEDFLKNIELKLVDIDQLIQQLIYDDRLEEMPAGGYRSVRAVWHKPGRFDSSSAVRRVGPCDPDDEGYAPGNGLTQSPCGRCPVKSDCRVGGIINPDGCQYMTNWLEQLMF